MKRVSSLTDSEQLRTQQYKNASNLSTRIAIHVDYSTNPIGVWQWFFDMLLAAVGSEARILEVGCGRGDLWLQNADRIPEGWTITLTDLSEGMLEDARKNLGELAGRFRLQTANVQELAFEDDQFDAVIANFMLYHAPDREQAVGELRRVLQPSGVLFACTLGQDHMRQFWELVRAAAPAAIPDYQGVDNTFGLENGEAQLRTAFSDVVMVPYDCNLKVTEAQPLVDYFHSNGDADVVSGKYDEAFRQEAQRQIDDHGYVFIQKATGCFVARGDVPGAASAE